jgi:hypothetical protein
MKYEGKTKYALPAVFDLRSLGAGDSFSEGGKYEGKTKFNYEV